MIPEAHGFFAGKRLIVFGAGYVGAELARQALGTGLKVFALTRNADQAAALERLGMVAVRADLASSDWHPELPADAEFVVNCVSSGGGSAGYRHSYVEGLQSILAWTRARGPVGSAGTLVYTSSTSVYPQDGGLRVTEEAPTVTSEGNPKILLEAEALARRWPGRSFVFRLAGIYGPGRHHLLDQLRAGERTFAGRGEHHLNLIHRDDAVSAIWSALAATATDGGIFNVADDGAAPKTEVIRWLAGVLGREMPGFSGAAASGRRLLTPDRVIANDRIKQVLGWRPRYATFREGYAAILGGAG